MPNDDNADFAASQRSHAERARVIREVSRYANVPANQVRQALHQVEKPVSQQGVQVASQIPRPRSLPAPLDLSPVRHFDARPFQPVPAVPVEPVAGQQETGMTVSTTVCVDNGMGGFTQKTANFVNGRLVSIT